MVFGKFADQADLIPTNTPLKGATIWLRKCSKSAGNQCVKRYAEKLFVDNVRSRRKQLNWNVVKGKVETTFKKKKQVVPQWRFTFQTRALEEETRWGKIFTVIFRLHPQKIMYDCSKIELFNYFLAAFIWFSATITFLEVTLKKCRLERSMSKDKSRTNKKKIWFW